jgi:hypothetical protein
MDATGTVMVFDKKGLNQNQACLVKRGIVLKTDDVIKITGTKGTMFDKFEGQFGRLGEWNKQNRGFEIALEDTDNVIVFKGAYFVKSSFTSMQEKMDFWDFFNDHDQNRDGMLSPGEFLVKSTLPMWAGTSFMDADLGSVGQAKKKSEVWMWCAGWAFRKYDKNLDEKISREEFLPYFRELGQHATGRLLSEQTAVQV